MSIDKTTKFSYIHYLSRRFARIFPVYCIVIVVLWWLGGSNSYLTMFAVKPRDILDLLSHLTFINLWDVRHQNTIIGIEWTVPIEMWMYLVIPPVYFLMDRSDEMWGWILLITATALSMENQPWHQRALGMHWAIETYLYCFVAGVVAYTYYDKLCFSERVADVLAAALIVAIGVLCIDGEYLSTQLQIYLVLLSPGLPYAGGSNSTERLLTLLMMALILTLSQARYMRKFFENHIIIFFGNISFSFYLLHFPVLNYFTNLQLDNRLIPIAGLFSTAVIAYICHQIIEKPALRMTGRLHPYDK